MTALENQFVRLEPLSEQHIPALLEIAQNTPAEVYALTHVPKTLEAMTAYVRTALDARDAKKAIPFATTANGIVVGSTRFGNIEYWDWARKTDNPDAAEIGWTWLAPSTQRTQVNTAAKLLMLEFAFETWQVQRMTLKTDARNDRSRNAILRLGASFEGVLRAHMPSSDGGIRNTAMYSILESEWADVKKKLQNYLLETR
jgi:RimJ/RimL family protein N-acetyltransferase